MPAELMTSPQQPAAPAGGFLALIHMAIEKGNAVDQLGKLLDMQERYEKAQAAREFAAALTAFQAEVPVIRKTKDAVDTRDGKNKVLYSYASYDDVMAAAAPVLARYGIVVSFSTEQTPGSLKVVCRVRVGTHTEETPFTVPIPKISLANETQLFGGALSYAKRYCLCAALNLVTTGEDQDAAELFERITAEQVEELEELIRTRNANLKAFLEYAEAESLADIPQSKFAKLADKLSRKPVVNQPKEAAK
jgi:hypothetical protein